MEKILEITITANDFKTTDYYNHDNCALAKALKRSYPDKIINVGGTFVNIDKDIFQIENGVDIPEIYFKKYPHHNIKRKTFKNLKVILKKS